MTVPKRQIGLITAIALVLGNMVGSGIFLLPASLAPYGGYSLIGWVVSSIGALLLASVFYRLAKRAPRSGGPYAYTREAFGDCPGFLVGWMYWLSMAGGNAAIAVGFASYLSVFFPAISARPLLGALAALLAIWVLTGVNIAGVRSAGKVQVVTTILKLAPLLALAIFGLAHFDARLLVPGPAAGTPLHAISLSVAATLFAFVGVESATIPAGHVRNPGKTIPRATLIGTAVAAVVYIACSAAVMGLLPAGVLAKSDAPFAAAGQLLWGGWAAWLIGGAAAISCFGALNGWILTAGQFAQAVARDGLFPHFLASDSSRGTPVPALVASAVVNTVMVLANYSHGLVAMFTFIVLLTTLANIVAYLFSSMADVVLAHRGGGAMPWRNLVLACGAFAFSLWAALGAGEEAVYWNFALLIIGIPLYAWQLRHVQRRRRADGTAGEPRPAG